MSWCSACKRTRRAASRRGWRSPGCWAELEEGILRMAQSPPAPPTSDGVPQQGMDRIHRMQAASQEGAAPFFTSDLSVNEFLMVEEAGFDPLGLVVGSSIYHIGYHVAHQGWRQTMRQFGQNTEVPQFTQAIYEARELAMDRMQYEAMQLQADGIVGMQIVEKPYYWGSHVIEFFAIGNAVNALRKDHQIAKPGLVMPLTG